jgi:hypothetical protein
MKTVNVTTKELTFILLSMPKSIGSIANILQCTTPDALKKDRDNKTPFTSELRKVTKLNVLLSTEYEKGVLNQLKRENKAESEYIKGENKMPIEFDKSNNEYCGFFKGEAVIQYRPFEQSNPKVKFVLNGKITEKEKLPNVLPIKNKATNQGTEKEILWRKLYVANIRKIKLNGVIYKNIECKL